MSDRPAAPVDPRTDWGLPAPGGMPPVAALDEVTTRVLAPNPSPMTLDGTNTYLLAAPASGVAVVVDPGPEDVEHLRRVEAALGALDAEVGLLVVTHHHHDHAAAAAGWSLHFGATVAAADRELAGPDGRLLADGDVVDVAGLALEVVATPGHTADHVSLRTPTGAVLTGDHVLGRGTSVVAHPDGNLAAYLHSLRRTIALGPDALYPGHGPELTVDAQAVLRYYAEHRAFRQAQLVAALDEGPATAAQLVARIYADVDRRLWPAAEASTRAALELLHARGEIAWHDGVATVLP
ncbi:MBL fold metallo-hydrolase [Egicoccus sp. AB-alg6-2]|uniref:MBL fold metallo-hydrolase n=1 Tax=Egicoccus sp. AB-alg6-2 TaxID=3242692 RepID=UPI00359CE60F